MPTLEWIGKSKVINHHQEVPFRVLERKYSFDENGQHDEDNGSENMIIRGRGASLVLSALARSGGFQRTQRSQRTRESRTASISRSPPKTKNEPHHISDSNSKIGHTFPLAGANGRTDPLVTNLPKSSIRQTMTALDKN